MPTKLIKKITQVVIEDGTIKSQETVKENPVYDVWDKKDKNGKSWIYNSISPSKLKLLYRNTFANG